MAHAKELVAIRKQLFKTIPYKHPRQEKRSMIHKSEHVNRWCLPFLGSDRPVATRTQRFLYETEKKPPVQIQTYVQFGYIMTSLCPFKAIVIQKLLF